jgi:hypothetical protein
MSRSLAGIEEASGVFGAWLQPLTPHRCYGRGPSSALRPFLKRWLLCPFERNGSVFCGDGVCLGQQLCLHRSKVISLESATSVWSEQYRKTHSRLEHSCRKNILDMVELLHPSRMRPMTLRPAGVRDPQAYHIYVRRIRVILRSIIVQRQQPATIGFRIQQFNIHLW